jgi:hypothetical protein
MFRRSWFIIESRRALNTQKSPLMELVPAIKRLVFKYFISARVLANGEFCIKKSSSLANAKTP